MTTVGYGDKAPKFIVTRLLAVIWILVGITICSLFTASLTSEITSAVTPNAPTMEGKTVGIIKGRFYDAGFVTNQRGLI